MKNALVFLVVSLISLFEVAAQINLEHTFSSNASVNYITTETQIIYYYYNASNIYFYNEDYTLYKTISVPNLSGYAFGNITLFSTHWFNTDEYIEFSCNYHKYDYSDVRSILYNENLELIKSFDSSLLLSVYPTENNGLRINANRYNYSLGEYVVDVYSLPGTFVYAKEYGSIEQILPPFPNPAGNEIIIPYTINENETTKMFILDMSGKVIDSFQIGGYFNKIRVNTSSYTPGTYIYRYNNVSNKFVIK